MGNLKVFTIQGRLNRKPYNIFSLAMLLVSFFMMILVEKMRESLVIMNESDVAGKASESDINTLLVFALLMLIIAIFMLIAEFTLTIRRMHDLNLSGWCYLLFCVPNVLTAIIYNENSLPIMLISIVLSLIPLIFCLCLIFKRGTVGENKYGKDPLSE